jgi:serine/threonine protein kinase
VVYKARDTHLDRFVAIKVLPPEKVADPERKRRFVQEAKAASALNHPNIIHIYDIDQAAGTEYIAMEYVPGKTLDQLMGRKGLKLSETLRHGVQIADALSRAHAASTEAVGCTIRGCAIRGGQEAKTEICEKRIVKPCAKKRHARFERGFKCRY